MRVAGVEGRLEVYEAMSHDERAFVVDSPESAEVFDSIVRFFESHLLS